MFEFIYKNATTEITVTTEEVVADGVVEAFRSFLLAAGFHPKTVEEVLPDAP